MSVSPPLHSSCSDWSLCLPAGGAASCLGSRLEADAWDALLLAKNCFLKLGYRCRHFCGYLPRLRSAFLKTPRFFRHNESFHQSKVKEREWCQLQMKRTRQPFWPGNASASGRKLALLITGAMLLDMQWPMPKELCGDHQARTPPPRI